MFPKFVVFFYKPEEHSKLSHLLEKQRRQYAEQNLLSSSSFYLAKRAMMLIVLIPMEISVKIVPIAI